MGSKRKGADDGQLEILKPAQVFLFENHPEQPELLKRIKDYAHTGKRFAGNPDRWEPCIAAMINGAPLRAIAKEYHVGIETLTSGYRLLEEAGILRSFKERMKRGWQETLLLTQWRINEALVLGQMPLQVLPALAGIGTDKILLLDTHSGAEGAEQKTVVLSPEQYAEAAAAARRFLGGGPVIDAQSVEALPKSLSGNGDAGADTRLDTGAGLPAVAGDRVQGLDLADGEGGGDRVSGAGAEGRGDGDGKF
jgi:hypothetical protein